MKRSASLLLSMALLVPTLASPDWWPQAPASATPNDFAPCNLGQVKNMASHAAQHLSDNGFTPPLQELRDSWSTTPSGKDYSVANIGQLKATSLPFWEALIAEGQATTDDIPWSATTSDDSDYSVANIGQLKNVFNFTAEPLVTDTDTDEDSLSDEWEQQIIAQYYPYGSIYDVDPDGDEDGDGLTNLEEYSASSDPTDYYNGAEHNLEYISGAYVSIPYGSVSQEPVVYQLLSASGQPLPNAPVNININEDAEWGTMLSLHENGAFARRSFSNVRTDAKGEIRFWYVAPLAPEYNSF